MLAQLLARRGVAHGGLGMEQQGQLGPLDQPLLAGRPAHEALERGLVTGRQLWVIGWGGSGHWGPPDSIAYSPFPLYTNL